MDRCEECEYSRKSDGEELHCMRTRQSGLAKMEREYPWLIAKILGVCGKSGRFFKKQENYLE